MTAPLLLFAPLALVALAGCSSNDPSADRNTTSDGRNDDVVATAPAAGPHASASGTASAEGVISLNGAAGLTIGEAVPAGSDFSSSGSAPGRNCQIYTSRSEPGVTALVEGGAVKRITISEGADEALEEGITVGSTAPQTKSKFPGFVETPHKYAGAPAAYLTQPGDDPRLRFEIGTDDRVESIHIGVMPQLAYVEGCS